MSATDIVQDAPLVGVLDSASNVREACLRILEMFDERDRQFTHSDLSGNDAIKSPASPATPADADLDLRLSNLLKDLYGDLSQLRAVNRSALMGVRRTKEATSEARSEVDRLHLQLQNLYYERRHLRGEIVACQEYDHKYQQLPLIPVEDFLEQRPDLRDADESALMEARIGHEHAARKALEEDRQALLKKKQGLIADNNKRKEDLANLDKDLEKFIEAADPIVKTFEKEY